MSDVFAGVKLQVTLKGVFFLMLPIALALSGQPLASLTQCMVSCLAIGGSASLLFLGLVQRRLYTFLGTPLFMLVTAGAAWGTMFDYLILQKPVDMVFEEGLLTEGVAYFLIHVLFGIPVAAVFGVIAEILVSYAIALAKRWMIVETE